MPCHILCYQDHCCCRPQNIFIWRLKLQCGLSVPWMNYIKSIFSSLGIEGSLCSKPEMLIPKFKIRLVFESAMDAFLKGQIPMLNRYEVTHPPSPSSIRSPLPWPEHEPVESLSPGPKGKVCWIFLKLFEHVVKNCKNMEIWIHIPSHFQTLIRARYQVSALLFEISQLVIRLLLKP